MGDVIVWVIARVFLFFARVSLSGIYGILDGC